MVLDQDRFGFRRVRRAPSACWRWRTDALYLGSTNLRSKARAQAPPYKGVVCVVQDGQSAMGATAGRVLSKGESKFQAESHRINGLQCISVADGMTGSEDWVCG
jgi:hypothetical protein